MHTQSPASKGVKRCGFSFLRQESAFFLLGWRAPGHIYPSGDAEIWTHLVDLFLKPSLWGITALLRRAGADGFGKSLPSQHKAVLLKKKKKKKVPYIQLCCVHILIFCVCPCVFVLCLFVPQSALRINPECTGSIHVSCLPLLKVWVDTRWTKKSRDQEIDKTNEPLTRFLHSLIH